MNTSRHRVDDPLSSVAIRFATGAVRRKNAFLALSIGGLVVALAFTAHLTRHRIADPTYPLGARGVIVVLILLNARHNLRQFRYASLLEGLLAERANTGDSAPASP